MCGFVGYIGRAPLVSRQRLVHMRDALRHRGPDDAGVFVDVLPRAAVGLGHRRLSILDTRAVGKQPMAGPEGKLQIAFNGEIYNFKDLRAELESQGSVFRTHTDTEVLLHLYRARGVDCLQALNGMFSFALWDPERRLVATR